MPRKDRRKTANIHHRKIKDKNRQIQSWFVILVLLFTPLLYYPGMMDASLLPRQIALALSLVTMAVLLLQDKYALETIPNANILGHKIFWLHTAMVIWISASLFYAPNPSEAFNESLKQAAFLAFFVLSALIINQEDHRYDLTIKAVTLFALLASFSGVFQYLIEFQDIEITIKSIYRFTGLFSHRNLYAEVLFLSLPFTLLGIISLKKKGKIFCSITGSMTLIICIILMVRSVWFGLALSSLTAIILILSFSKTLLLNQLILRRLSFGLFAGVSLIALVLVLYSQFISAEILRERIKEMTQSSYGTTMTRAIIWKGSLEMFADHPVMGSGAGSWKTKIPAYHIHDNLDGYSNMRMQRPHNDFLWILTENGSVGLALYLLIIITIFIYGLKIIRQEGRQQEKWFTIVLLSGITGYLSISLFSFPRERIEHNILFFLMLSYIVHWYHERFPAKRLNIRLTRKAALVFVLIIGLCSVFVTSIRIKGEIQLKRAFEDMKAQRHQAVIGGIEKSFSWFYTLDPFSTPVLWYKGIAQYQSGDSQQAQHTFQRAYQHNPWHSHVLTSLGILQDDLGQKDKALDYYYEALLYNPKYKTARLRILLLVLEQEAYAEAVQLLMPLKLMPQDPRFDPYIPKAIKGRLAEFFASLDEPALLTSPWLNSDEWLRDIYFNAMLNDQPIELLAIERMQQHSAAHENHETSQPNWEQIKQEAAAHLKAERENAQKKDKT